MVELYAYAKHCRMKFKFSLSPVQSRLLKRLHNEFTNTFVTIRKTGSKTFSLEKQTQIFEFTVIPEYMFQSTAYRKNFFIFQMNEHIIQ